MKKAIISLSVIAAIVLTVLACSKINKSHELEYDEWEVGNNGLIYKTNDRLYDPSRHKTLVRDIEWLQYESYDSIGVLAKDGKRAYVNLNTGELITTLTYDRGWFYRSNRGVMERNDSLFVFDRSGRLLNKVGIPAHGDNTYEYIFNDGKLIVETAPDIYGIIDTSARWILNPVYESIEHDWNNQLYCCKLGDVWTVFNYDLDTILSGKWKNLTIDYNSGIIATETNGMEHLYSYEGEMIYKVIYQSIDEIYYDEEPTGCYKYTTYGGKCGLMDSNYHPLTAPQFYDITAKSRTIFFAEFGSWYNDFGVLLNRNGQTMN